MFGLTFGEGMDGDVMKEFAREIPIRYEQFKLRGEMGKARIARPGAKVVKSMSEVFNSVE